MLHTSGFAKCKWPHRDLIPVPLSHRVERVRCAARVRAVLCPLTSPVHSRRELRSSECPAAWWAQFPSWFRRLRPPFVLVSGSLRGAVVSRRKTVRLGSVCQKPDNVVHSRWLTVSDARALPCVNLLLMWLRPFQGWCSEQKTKEGHEDRDGGETPRVPQVRIWSWFITTNQKNKKKTNECM